MGLVLLLLAAPVAVATAANVAATVAEAPAGFDDRTNDMVSQSQFDADREVFEERELAEDGLGPTYNAQACAECHENPVTGGNSQVSVLRAGRYDGRRYTDHAGGSLIQDRALDPSIQERAHPMDNVRTFRASLSVLGDGFVEAIPDAAFADIQARQPMGMKGTILQVPVLEAPGTTRIGRFGWKDQHASLLSFSADAYLNEMGITSPLQPTENTANGASVDAWDLVNDPEEEPTAAEPFGADVEAFARFMRSTRVPARDANLARTAEAQAGEQVFNQLGCQHCHTPAITTAPAGTAINGGKFVVPAALGGKVIHPYGDFMMHDVGTGDGIIQNGGEITRNKIRTAPLWGLRTRSRLLHDGTALTPSEAILRHDREARMVAQAFQRLPREQRDVLMAFLNSL
ncbi:MAG TPA: di-heme oxidoredictase family protein [Thermoanaerobaculia bacterium]|nr:di-heme oxidoredictase family protein [Thermoanaerobaculia bacterium]